jgi:hypothetical protein
MGLEKWLFGGDEDDRDEFDFLGNLDSLGFRPESSQAATLFDDLRVFGDDPEAIRMISETYGIPPDDLIAFSNDPGALQYLISSGGDRGANQGLGKSGQSPGVLANINQFLQQAGLTRKDLTWGDIARGGLSLYAGIQSKNAAEEENERRRKLADEEKARRDRLEAENAAARERYNKGMYNPNVASLGTQATRLR